MWTSLPVELQRQCLQSLDVASLCSLRLANKSISTIVTEILFQSVSLQPDEESAEKFHSVLGEEELRALVRTVIFNTSDDPDYRDGELRQEADLKPYYKQCLKKFTQFEKLREVQVKFARACAVPSTTSAWDREVVETVWFRTEVLRKLFKPLARAIEEGGLEFFDTLTIKNLQDHVDGEIYRSENFKAVLARVNKLHLSIATETDDDCPEDSINKRGCHEFFNEDLLTHWLGPVQSHLTHLSLFATECPWGFWPLCDLRKTHLPRLRSLSLGNWIIAHDWQIDWIISHAATLQELVLIDCPILSVAKMNDREALAHWPDIEPIYTNTRFNTRIYLQEIKLRWHDVFARLHELTKLTKFGVFLSQEGDEVDIFEERYKLGEEFMCRWNRHCTSRDEWNLDRYCMFDMGLGPTQWVMGGSYWVMVKAGDRHRVGSHVFYTGKKEREAYYFPQCDEEDMKALAELVKAVEGRVGKSV